MSEDKQGASAWEWWAGANDEFYQAGPCASRDEAVEEGLNNWDDRPVHIIEALRGEWPAPCAESVIDYMFENSDDLFSEDYPDPLGTKVDMEMATADLQCALDKWMDKWRHTIFPTPTAFRASRNREVVLPPIIVAAEAIAAFAQAVHAGEPPCS